MTEKRLKQEIETLLIHKIAKELNKKIIYIDSFEIESKLADNLALNTHLKANFSDPYSKKSEIE